MVNRWRRFDCCVAIVVRVLCFGVREEIVNNRWVSPFVFFWLFIKPSMTAFLGSGATC
jgi:hypothetical protein